MDKTGTENGRLTRRSMIAMAGYAVVCALLPTSLAGCGGSGSSGGVPGTQPDGTGNAMLSVKRSDIAGSAFVARACWAGGADDCDVLTDAEHSLVTVHADRAQAISLHDQDGRLAALAVSHGTATRAPQTIEFSAATNAESIVFITPGILSCDPAEARDRLQIIRTLPSFGTLSDSLKASGGLGGGLSPQAIQYARACVDEYMALQARSRGSQETLLLAEWMEGYTKIRVSNYAWRAVNLRCKCIDGGKVRVGSVLPLSNSLAGGVMMGGVPAGWSNLFHPGAPTEYSFPVSLADHRGTTTAQLWVQGPGKAEGAAPLPPDVPRADPNYVVSTLFYIVLPMIDFFGGATRGLDALKNANGFLGSFGTTMSFPEEAALAEAVREKNVAAGLSALSGIVMGMVTGYASPIADALKIGGIAKSVLTKGLPLVAAALAVVNVSFALLTWLALPDVHHVDVGVNYRRALTKVDDGKGAPPFDWTHASDLGDIPFGEYRSQISVGEGNAPGALKTSRDFGGVPVHRVHVMQKMNNSVSVSQGAVVGVVRAVLADGGTIECQLVAGVNTAEWAWDREDKLGRRPRHDLPATDFPQRLNDPSVPGGSYAVKHFYVQINLAGDDGPRRLQRLELEMYPSGLPSNFGLDIYGITADYAVT